MYIFTKVFYEGERKKESLTGSVSHRVFQNGSGAANILNSKPVEK
jgi:hypothetical protein